MVTVNYLTRIINAANDSPAILPNIICYVSMSAVHLAHVISSELTEPHDGYSPPDFVKAPLSCVGSPLVIIYINDVFMID